MPQHSLIATAALLGLQPITADSLWWHVARGREAIDFNLLPSASLLRADVAAESDWLSGVPMALAFDLAGLHGLMLLQFDVVIPQRRPPAAGRSVVSFIRISTLV